ncbi:MAG TPA: hypothetical protein VF477_21665 [Mycobacterium sp.]
MKAGSSDAAVESDPDETNANDAGASGGDSAAESTRRARAARLVAFVLLPIALMLLALGAGFFKFEDSSVRDADLWRAQSVQAAKDGTVAMLSYRPDTVDKDLGAAQNRLTGDFKNSYTTLTHDVVIPGAKQRQISAVASVPAAASVSVTDTDAVVIVFVNQTTILATEAPTDSASTVKVTLKRSGNDWLISGFDPI